MRTAGDAQQPAAIFALDAEAKVGQAGDHHVGVLAPKRPAQRASLHWLGERSQDQGPIGDALGAWNGNARLGRSLERLDPEGFGKVSFSF